MACLLQLLKLFGSLFQLLTLEQLMMYWEFLARLEPEPPPPDKSHPNIERPPPTEVVALLCRRENGDRIHLCV